MKASLKTALAAALAIAALPALAQTTPVPVPAPVPAAPAPAVPAAPAPPLFATTKVTDNVYIFRYQGHQSMFVVTKAGVIATDPISLGRPAAAAYLEEIRKITAQPVRFVVYSHHHFDHIAGGKPFKDQGAKFIAHNNAKRRLDVLNSPDVVPVDVAVGNKHVISMGGVRLELHYTGRNHSDNSLVMYLPKEKIIFAVDFLPLQSLLFRNMADTYLPDYHQSVDRVLAMDFERMIPGHPGPGGRQIGTKADVQTVREYMTDLSAEVKKQADQGRCFDTAMKEVQLPKYATLNNYAAFLAGNVERYCGFWRIGS